MIDDSDIVVRTIVALLLGCPYKTVPPNIYALQLVVLTEFVTDAWTQSSSNSEITSGSASIVAG